MSSLKQKFPELTDLIKELQYKLIAMNMNIYATVPLPRFQQCDGRLFGEIICICEVSFHKRTLDNLKGHLKIQILSHALKNTNS